MNFEPVRKFALCGHPVAHSLSPALFAAAYPNNKCSYELICASTAQEAIERFQQGGFSGMNITAPLKSDILTFADEQSPACIAIGAANILLQKDNKLFADNFDTIGVIQSLVEANANIQGSDCLLLGAGGAARAAAYALLQNGANLFWANRTISHIPLHFAKKNINPMALDSCRESLRSCKIIVNTLPIAIPQTDALSFSSGQIILDASYTHRPLQSIALKAGAAYVDGSRWLYHQAIPSFLAFTGLTPNYSAMNQILQKALLSANNCLF